MSFNKLSIPKTLKIGYQKRKDTYTKKLAYVTYVDDKGKHRKEPSWNSWRDHKIDPDDYDNEPLSGFVLNKKVGDYRGSWNGRQAWIRIYDPRGFEFEIDVDNLLFILEECSAIKGKGLEGEFIYAWEGKNHILLPTSCQEYQKSLEFSGLQNKKVTKKDMREGCLYMNKDNEKVMYLGRHDYHTYGWCQGSSTKQHVFHYVDKSGQEVYSDSYKDYYWIQKGFTKLAVKLTEEPDASFVEEFDRFKQSRHSSPPINKFLEFPAVMDIEFDEDESYHSCSCFHEHSDGYYYKLSIDNWPIVYGDEEIDGFSYRVSVNGRYKRKDGNFEDIGGKLSLKNFSHLGNYEEKEIPHWHRNYKQETLSMKPEDFDSFNFVQVFKVNEFGQKCLEI